jgi:hypothetical protein
VKASRADSIPSHLRTIVGLCGLFAISLLTLFYR